jgi:hypothetical protein
MPGVHSIPSMQQATPSAQLQHTCQSVHSTNTVADTSLQPPNPDVKHIAGVHALKERSQAAQAA